MIETRWFRGISFLLIAACVVVRSVEGLFYLWNPIRFSRGLALVRGYDLYSTPDSGVIAGIIYGPVGFLLYAPAAVWSSPLPAVFTACLVSALLTLGPAALLLSDRRISDGARAWVLPLFLSMVLHFYASGTTPGVWMVHTDAGAFGFVCLALWATLRHPLDRPFSWPLAAAALFAALAVWAKQTTVPIVLLPCLYFLWRGCVGAAAWVFGLTGGFGLLLGAVFCAFYGFDELWLAMFAVPSHHDLHVGAPVYAWRLMTDFMEIVYLIGVVVAACVAIRKDEAEPGSGSPKTATWWSRSASWVPDWTGWPLLCATGLAMLPTALLGLMKAGGTANNLGLVDYFLSLGVGVMFLRLAARPEFVRGAARRALEASLLVLLAAMALRAATSFVMFARETPGLWPPPIQLAHEYARKHPGTTYFPWHPLASLMAEDRYDHTAWGVMERESAGFPVSEAHFREWLPRNLERIAVTGEQTLVSAIERRDWNHYLLRRLPEFRCRVNDPELPGWAVLERGPEDCEEPRRRRGHETAP